MQEPLSAMDMPGGAMSEFDEPTENALQSAMKPRQKWKNVQSSVRPY